MKTPAFVIDRAVLRRNIDRMAEHAQKSGVKLRPHVKTHKTVEIARMQTESETEGITVSTLAEARFFVDAGFEDITYAFPITPDKLDEAAALTKKLRGFHILLDHPETAFAVDRFARSNDVRFSVFLKVDPGYHRAGVSASARSSVKLAGQLCLSKGTTFKGILTHGGHSYDCRNVEEIQRVADEERESMITLLKKLRKEGIPCPTVSAGSTPTASHGTNWEGITELRPGNYVFFDLFQSEIGTCDISDCAVSVLATVAGHYPQRNRLLVDAGALALSKDRGAAHMHDSDSFGMVMGHPEMRVVGLSQEHGLIGGSTPIRFEKFPLGRRIRIIPNHSCLAAALFPSYHVLDGDEVTEEWTPVRGW